jgi:hypothetical protein
MRKFCDWCAVIKKIVAVLSALPFAMVVYGSGAPSVADGDGSLEWLYCHIPGGMSNWYEGVCGKIRELQAELPKDMVLFDFHRSDIGGFLAFLAVRFAMNHPDESTVIVSGRDFGECCASIADRITADFSDRSPEAVKRIGILSDLVSDGEGYDQYVRGDDFLWPDFLRDLKNGGVQFDTALLPYVAMGMKMSVSEVDGIIYVRADNDPGTIFSVIVPVEDDHFIVILPGKAGNGLGISIEYRKEDGCPPLQARVPSRFTLNDGNQRAPSEHLHWHGRADDAILDATAESSYCSLLDDTHYYAEICERLVEIQGKLPKNIILFDVPGFGRCGYFAILALQFARTHPGEPVVRISRDDCLWFCVNIAKQVARDICVKDIGGADERIGVLSAIILAGTGAYGGYVSGNAISWRDFLEDMRNGRIPLDVVLLPFVRVILNLDVTVVEERNITAENIHRDGALVHFGTGHFMVALPRAMADEAGVEMKLECQERSGRWWLSPSNMPVQFLSERP